MPPRRAMLAWITAAAVLPTGMPIGTLGGTEALGQPLFDDHPEADRIAQIEALPESKREALDHLRHGLIDALEVAVSAAERDLERARRGVVRRKQEQPVVDEGGRVLYFDSRQTLREHVASTEARIERIGAEITALRSPGWAPDLDVWRATEAIRVGDLGFVPSAAGTYPRGDGYNESENPLVVSQVRNPREMIISAQRSSQLTVRRWRHHPQELVMVRGISTTGLVDGQEIDLAGILFEVTGTETYRVPYSGTNTVFVLRPAGGGQRP